MKRKAKRIVPSAAKSHKIKVMISAQKDDGYGNSVPPSLTNVEIYFDQKGVLESARDFYDQHELRGWKNVTGQPVTNWKVCAAEWIYNYRQEVKRRLRQSSFNSESF